MTLTHFCKKVNDYKQNIALLLIGIGFVVHGTITNSQPPALRLLGGFIIIITLVSIFGEKRSIK